MKPKDLNSILASFEERWSPRIVAELNGQHVKVAKLQGSFVWHHHAEADELFLVLRGQLLVHMRDGTIQLGPGQCFVVPRGVEHKPEAPEETHVLLFEPVGTLNTGNVRDARTVERPEQG